ncbi:hypothetical protein [Nitrobacter vulgaris]|nr:hypothetical protein [Nitrobacter vulgaris]
MSDDQISVLFEGNDNGQATGDRVAGALFAGWQRRDILAHRLSLSVNAANAVFRSFALDALTFMKIVRS